MLILIDIILIKVERFEEVVEELMLLVRRILLDQWEVKVFEFLPSHNFGLLRSHKEVEVDESVIFANF